MQARRLPARHGFLWLIASFRLFRTNPPLITALTMGYLFLVVILRELPLGPFVLTLALPTLVVILANGCRAVQRGGGIGGVTLIYGLKGNRNQIIQLGGLLLVGAMLIVMIMLAINGEKLNVAGEMTPMSEEDKTGLMIQLLAISMPVITAFWFAPLLTAWENVAPMKSVFFSFVAVWRNWRAFLAYLLVVSVFAIGIPTLIMLGAREISDAVLKVVSITLDLVMLFVVWPITTTSVFVSYQDVFHDDSAGG